MPRVYGDWSVSDSDLSGLCQCGLCLWRGRRTRIGDCNIEVSADLCALWLCSFPSLVARTGTLAASHRTSTPAPRRTVADSSHHASGRVSRSRFVLDLHYVSRTILMSPRTSPARHVSSRSCFFRFRENVIESGGRCSAYSSSVVCNDNMILINYKCKGPGRF